MWNPNLAAAAIAFALAAASAPGDTNTIIVEATGQTTPGSTRVVSTTLGPFVGLSTHGFTVTARDEDQPGVDSNAAPLQLQVVGPVAGYTITDLDGEGNLQTRSGLPLDDSVNPGGIVHTGETIDFGVLSSIVGPHSRSLPFVLANETPNDDLGELTALSILNAAIEGPDAHQFTLFEADGVTPFDPAGHDALAPGESLELVIQFSMDDNLALKDPRNASLLIFTDQGAAFGGDGAIFQFGLTGVQIPEPSSIALWLLLGGSAIFLLVRQKKR